MERYWSSSEVTSSKANMEPFDVGGERESSKNNLLRVRAVRSF